MLCYWYFKSRLVRQCSLTNLSKSHGHGVSFYGVTISPFALTSKANIVIWTSSIYIINHKSSQKASINLFNMDLDWTGMQDFIPEKSNDCYEPFDQLSDHANTWLKDQSDVIVTNMQSVMAQVGVGKICIWKCLCRVWQNKGVYTGGEISIAMCITEIYPFTLIITQYFISHSGRSKNSHPYFPSHPLKVSILSLKNIQWPTHSYWW